MLEQKYFVTRLGDIYEYSRIQYRCGEGTSNQGQHYFWELCVDVSGNIIFVLHLKDFSQPLEKLLQKIESFSSTSDNELWEINCTNVYILETNVDILETEVEIFRKITYFCISDTIILKQKGQKLSAISLAKAYFNNLSFSSINCERGFSVNINGKNLCFQMLEYNKEIIKLIKIKRISDALLSTVSIPINQNECIETIETEIESMSWFLSLLNLNVISVPIIESGVTQLVEESTKEQLNRSALPHEQC